MASDLVLRIPNGSTESLKGLIVRGYHVKKGGRIESDKVVIDVCMT